MNTSKVSVQDTLRYNLNWTIISYIFRRDYGFLGIALQQAVSKARNAPPPPTSDKNIAMNTSMTNASTAINSIASASMNRPQMQQITPRIS